MACHWACKWSDEWEKDETLLAVAEAFQQATDWHLRHPGVFEAIDGSVYLP
ncbi:hypothetical protein [Mesorhizobium escarrei]|uniref:Uncharacterized protein n=1 Tax=Mesorhizobium escarrei TaxID=666018 RepID=A0ABM9E767_9HYPH|nr:hypothetical protein [Mesorhizobium escarrei]CAH2404592.1 hypothetical protein MES5069_430006 [Mesorhizobium escarrei]